LARVEAGLLVTLDACLVSTDGRTMLRRLAAGPVTDAAEVGTDLAERMLADGAARFIWPMDESSAEDGARDA
jgi:porphobilinogen deaminase